VGRFCVSGGPRSHERACNASQPRKYPAGVTWRTRNAQRHGSKGWNYFREIFQSLGKSVVLVSSRALRDRQPWAANPWEHIVHCLLEKI
jgi:hypothetical protein